MFGVATGKLDAVYEVEARMVCWDNNGNKIVIVTKDGEQDHEGRKVVFYNMHRTLYQ